MDLTTAASVKSRLSSLENVDSFDALLGAYVSQLSAAAVQILGRETQTAERTQVFRLARAQAIVSLPAYPVSAVTTVEIASLQNEDWCSVDHWFDADSGTLELIREITLNDVRCRVTWTGGMAADTASFVAAFPDIAGAVADQVAFAFQRRDQLGLAAKGAGGASVQIAVQDWIPSARAILEHHRRVVL